MIVNIISCECLDYTPEISFEVCESTEVYNADGPYPDSPAASGLL